MKKLMLISLMLIAGVAFGQTSLNYSLPIWGAGPPANDNTGRILPYGLISTDPGKVGASKDTVKLYPNYWETLVQPYDSIHDTITYTIPIIPNNFGNGSIVKFYGIFANAGGRVQFRNVYGAGVMFKYSTAADSNISPTAKKHFYVSFMYDGKYLIETGKATGQLIWQGSYDVYYEENRRELGKSICRNSLGY